MLDIAGKYEAKLQELFANICFDEKYMFMYGQRYRDKYKSAESTWDQHEFVSVDMSKEIIGYIRYSINREDNSVYGLQIINFSDNKALFGKDLMECLDDVFMKFKFRKMTYCVFVGNPIEKSYDKLTIKFGGRIVGTYNKDSILLDGNCYDRKLYEIHRDVYLLHRNIKIKG